MSKKKIKEFAKYWNELVEKGIVSPFNRREWLSIEIYENWRKRQVKKEDNNDD